MPNKLFLLLVMSFLFAACTGRTTAPPVAPQRPTQTVCSTENLQKQMQEIASITKGPAGAAALILETGEKASISGSEHFPMQSVYKLPIASFQCYRLSEWVAVVLPGARLFFLCRLQTRTT